tara:strand:+ start:591 stop:1655 length:1065 start_codon:yes stop_codon:yes gene_type:complete
MEGMVTSSFWTNKTILVTGHTGFKGSWLSLWLSSLGAKVHGFSLSSMDEPNNFTALDIGSVLESNNFGDIRDIGTIRSVIHEIQPEIVIHLAAQSLVRESYLNPVNTFETNILGTINLLESIRSIESVRAFLNVTSDKCYDNDNEGKKFVEIDALGGSDPYSSSKACSELVTIAYKRSFFKENEIGIASARAGNVLGGGDWSKDRLLPDLLAAVDSSSQFLARYPSAIRPWQHVLEPLKGYLKLCENLYNDKDAYSSAWNFGPDGECLNVMEIIKIVDGYLPLKWAVDNSPSPNESRVLMLDSSRANQMLGWKPKLSIEKAIGMTIDWHQAWKSNNNMQAFSLTQIQEYEDLTS